MRVKEGDALLVVDVQRDFLPGGSLAVPDGDSVIAPLNACLHQFQSAGLPIVATRDWHPENHCSFAAQGGSWPAHCRQDSPGAAFAEHLDLPPGAAIVSKGTRENADAYSGFDGTDLGQRLLDAGVRRVFVGGLATDYCVSATVRDALKEGFDVFVIADAIRAVDLEPGDGARALGAMRIAGADFIESAELETDDE